MLINNKVATLTSSTIDEFFKKNAKQQMDRNWIQVCIIEKKNHKWKQNMVYI